jgi:translation initiation factor IF-2
MSEHPNQIRINDLARELEVKSKAILEVLPVVGVTEKKTHSSSIDVAHAELVRKHFKAIADAEAQAEAAAAAAKVAKEAAAKAARSRQAAAPAKPAAPVAALPAPVTAAPPAVVAPVASAAPTPAAKPPAGVIPKAPPAAPAVGARPAATATQKAVPPAAASAPAATRAAAPPRVPAAQRPAQVSTPSAKPLATPGQPIVKLPARPLFREPRPSGARPSASSAAGAPATGRPAPRHPMRPGQPTRPGLSRAGGHAAPGLPMDRVPPKAEPGKPIYARKPAPRSRPSADKRFEEGERKLHPVRSRPGAAGARAARAEPAVVAVPREPREITITEGVTVRELAEKLDIRAKELLKTLLDRGIFASINQALDTQTATSLAEAFSGIVRVISFEEEAVEEIGKVETAGKAELRPPVVTVMGHVDHGKTSLLDAVRSTDVAAGEAGGITQHIGAYQVEVRGKRVVFIDTPGHEAFTRMRARGARVTDIVVLVVAADDGIMPQTLEAIDHAKAAGVPIIVAVNKIDKPDAQPERVKRQLADRGLTPEEWGGDTVVVEVSARDKRNLDRLLESILLVADLRELKASADVPATGTVLESRVDKGRGPVATVLVQNGTLRVGDFFICGAVFGKVRAMFDDRGRPVKEAPPSSPVEVLGLQGVPEAGDQFQVADEAKARHIVDFRQSKRREATLARSLGSRITLDQLHEQLKSGEVKELPVVIKADVQGSVEVLNELLPKLSTEQVKLKIIHASVGAVAETDVLLASASGAIIIAFNVRPDRKASDLAQQEKVEIRTHTIIYELVDEIKKALAGLLEPVFKETYLGRAEVRDTFRVKGVGAIAGSYIQDGLVKRDAEVRLLRDNVVIFTGRISSLRRFKDDVGEVRAGFECGIGIANFGDVKVGDIIECFTVQKLVVAGTSA